jgi:hypothetical protein
VVFLSLILPWVVFPLVVAGIGVGWGVIVERAAATRVNDALLLPLGLAAALVVAGTLTAFTTTAPAAATVIAVGAVAGLVGAWPRWRPGRWPLLAAVGVLLAYGAPVLLSGQATFAGYVKLDDTATWFNVIDHVISHSRSISGEMPSTYSLVYAGYGGTGYPLGSFVLAGVGRALVGVDIAWVYQPYLACCGAAVALCVYALMTPFISSDRLRALLAFTAAQPALLYGYSLWGGIKEMTAAFLLALGVALAAALTRAPARWRELLPLAIAAGALIQTLGVGAVGWVAPAFVAVAAVWLWGQPAQGVRRGLISLAWLTGLSAAFVVPVWVVLGPFLGGGDSGVFTSGQPANIKLGNLIHPLSPLQLAGIWPVGDFRVTPAAFQSALWIGLVLIAAAAALFLTVRRRQFGVALYVAVALIGSGVIYLSGSTPWVTGKALAISSPALLTAALTGAALLWGRWARNRAGLLAGVTIMAALIGGVLWSNILAYHDVTLAPRQRLAEVKHIGELVAGKGPTFINEYEKYAEGHFLRNGVPIQMSKQGVQIGHLEVGELDSFPLSRLEPYRSIVTRRSPVESRPPSIYRLVWQGRYYQLWQRPAQPATRILTHIPLGEPAATPACARIQSLGRQALREQAQLVAYARPAPIVVRADQSLWPAGWLHVPAEHSLYPTTPGSAISHIAVANSQTYHLWLDGSFGRGFEVSVDGSRLGTVKDELSVLGAYVHLADVFLAAGVHTFVFTYPHSNLTPGSGDDDPLPSTEAQRGRKSFTSLSTIALEPQSPASALISAPAGQATQLCGRALNWIELVRASS